MYLIFHVEHKVPRRKDWAQHFMALRLTHNRLVNRLPTYSSIYFSNVGCHDEMKVRMLYLGSRPVVPNLFLF